MPTTTTSKMLAYKHALADALLVRAADPESDLYKVMVSTGFVETDAQDAIQFYEAEGTQTWGALGNRRREEEFQIGGDVSVQRPGKGEDVMRECETRAFAILAEVERELRQNPSVAEIADVVAMVSYRAEGSATASSRYCVIAFVIDGRKSLDRT